MKKQTSLILAGMLTCSLLVACSSGDGNTPDSSQDSGVETPDITPEVGGGDPVGDMGLDDGMGVPGDMGIPGDMGLPPMGGSENPFSELERALETPGTMAVNEQLEELFGLSPDLFSDYQIFIPAMMVSATEYALFTLVDEGNMDTLMGGIQTRLDALDNTWSQYLPDQYELVKNPLIVTQGSNVLFYIGEHGDYYENAFLRLFDPTLEALDIPITFRQLYGVKVIDSNEDGLVVEAEHNGETYLLTGLYTGSTYVEGELPEIGQLVDITYDTPIDAGSGHLESNVTFVMAVG